MPLPLPSLRPPFATATTSAPPPGAVFCVFASFYGMLSNKGAADAALGPAYEKASLLDDDQARDNHKARAVPLSLVIKDKY